MVGERQGEVSRRSQRGIQLLALRINNKMLTKTVFTEPDPVSQCSHITMVEKMYSSISGKTFYVSLRQIGRNIPNRFCKIAVWLFRCINVTLD